MNTKASTLATRYGCPEDAAEYAISLAETYPDLIISLAASISNARRKTKAGGRNGGRPKGAKDGKPRKTSMLEGFEKVLAPIKKLVSEQMESDFREKMKDPEFQKAYQKYRDALEKLHDENALPDWSQRETNIHDEFNAGNPTPDFSDVK